MGKAKLTLKKRIKNAMEMGGRASNRMKLDEVVKSNEEWWEPLTNALQDGTLVEHPIVQNFLSIVRSGPFRTYCGINIFHVGLV